MRVGIAAADPAVARGLQRLFTRRPGVESARMQAGPTGEAGSFVPDLLVVDVWPPTTAAAEDLCATWHEHFPAAVILAIVHRPSEGLLLRLAASGVRALWPKEDARGLVTAALGLMAADPADRPEVSEAP